MKRWQVAVASDIHFASAEERQRTNYCLGAIGNPLRRAAVRLYRHFYWMRDSFAHNHLLDEFIGHAMAADLVVANGDYSCDTAFVGISDDCALASATECLSKLQTTFGQRLVATIGDHELGKMPLGAKTGGLRLSAFERATERLNLQPFWQREVGNRVLMGITATLIALPFHEEEAIASELKRWRELRAAHLAAIREAFQTLRPEQRIILFCHDPTALPFLWEEEAVRSRIGQVEHTVIGHLHSTFIYWQSRLLRGMPVISWLGHTVKRLSSALRQARYWQPFNVVLCPSLAGIELLKDGGYLTLEWAADDKAPVKTTRHRLRR